MNAPVVNALISPDEIVRRRKVVTAADWSMRMEGLGKQTHEYDALSELWITGQISKTELNARTKQMVTEFIRERGHCPLTERTSVSGDLAPREGSL